MRWFRRPQPLIGQIDSPEEGSSFHALVRLEGWAVTRAGTGIQLEITMDGQPVPARITSKARPDVLKAYPWAAQRNLVPGFAAEFSVRDLARGSHELALWSATRDRRTKLSARTIRLIAAGEIPPPLLFVHIPKTAGTSLTAYLERQYPADTVLLHAENRVFQGSPEEIRRLGEFHLLSAHLEFETLERLVDVERHLKITVFREPLRQLASHLAWIAGLGAPAKRAELAHMPEYIRAAVERIGRQGHAGFLDTLTPAEARLLDNCQTRYLLPQATGAVDEGLLPAALERLERIGLVGTTERLDDFLLLLAYRMGWEPAEAAPRLNAGSREGLQGLASDGEVNERLEHLTRLDRVVYAAAVQRFERDFEAAAAQRKKS